MGRRLLHLIRALTRSTRGQDLVEYSLLLAFVGMVAIGFAFQTGNSAKGIANSAAGTLSSANANLATGSNDASGGGSPATGDKRHDDDHHDRR